MALFSQSSGFSDVAELVEAQQIDPQTIEDVEEQVMEAQQGFQAEVDTMSEVQVRMAKAKYYNALLEGPLFGNDAHHLAFEVEAEVRAFVLDQLRVFLGMKPESKTKQVAEVFDEQQIGALTMLANRVLKRPLMSGPQIQREEPQAPQVRVASVQERPQPQVRQPQPEPRIAVRQPQRPVRKAPPPVNGEGVKLVEHPLTGKMVPVTSIGQAQPQGVKPAEQPVGGNFVAQGQGGFVDMTGGAAAASSSAGVSQGAVGAGIGNKAVHGQLIDYFLRK